MRDPFPLPGPVLRAVAGLDPAGRKPLRLVKLKGDASEREFYRVFFFPTGSGDSGSGDSGSNRSRTAVLMRMPRPGADEEGDYLAMQRHLKASGVRVPEIFAYDKNRGLVLMEDGGDLLLRKKLSVASARERARDYRNVLRTLLDIQLNSGPRPGADCPGFHREFDEKKLMWELDFMLTHFVRGFRGKRPDSKTVRSLRGEFRKLCRFIASQPKVLAHRDYHSRNILWKGGKPFLVDFQDARMGCRQYDLASLLRDSYHVLSPRVRLELIRYYLREWERRTGEKSDEARFLRVFDATALQRNLKALGTFGYQVTQKKNLSFGRSIRPTVRYVREVLAARPEWRTLAGLLIPLIP